jgi:hypothetical protein
LAEYVDFLWCFHGPTTHRRKRVLPNGKVEILVNLAEPYRSVEGHGIELLAARQPVGGGTTAADLRTS